MGSSASYGSRELIQTYIQTQRHNHIHPDFKNYYTGLLTQLEQLFEVDFASPPSSQLALLAFIDYYNRTMAKPIKWTYTGLSPDRGAI